MTIFLIMVERTGDRYPDSYWTSEGSANRRLIWLRKTWEATGTAASTTRAGFRGFLAEANLENAELHSMPGRPKKAAPDAS
jgi:hypothetical protein